MIDLSPGERVGELVVEGPLGKGGMATVYRARDPLVGRDVALKLVDPLALGAEGLIRFRREAELAARVDGLGGVVRVHARGEHHGAPYLVLELVQGRDLSAILGEGPIEPKRLARMVERLARTLDRCHRAGVIHRDLKPSNVLVRDDDDEPLVADFGLARDLAAERLTQTGVLLGTPGYMAPEQALDAARAIGPKVDVYALGAILYHGLAGRAPFGVGPGAMVRSLQEDPPPPSQDRAVDPSLEAICLRALTRDPEVRPAAGELAEELAGWLRGDRVRPGRKPGRVVVGLLSTALVAGLVATLLSGLAHDGSRDDAGLQAELHVLEGELVTLIAAPHDQAPTLDANRLARLEQRLGEGPSEDFARQRIQAAQRIVRGEPPSPTPPGDELARALSARSVWSRSGPVAALERLGDAGQKGGAVALLKARLLAASSRADDLSSWLTAHRSDVVVWPAARPCLLSTCAAVFSAAAEQWDPDHLGSLAGSVASLDSTLPGEALDASIAPWRQRLAADLAAKEGELATAERLRTLLAGASAGPALRGALAEVYATFDTGVFETRILRGHQAWWERPLAWDDAVSGLDPSFTPPESHRRRLEQLAGISDVHGLLRVDYALACIRRGVAKRPDHAIEDVRRFVRPGDQARLERDGGGAAMLCLAAPLVVRLREAEGRAVSRMLLRETDDALVKALEAKPRDISPPFVAQVSALRELIRAELARD